MAEEKQAPLYWDTSAVLPLLVFDSHTARAEKLLLRPVRHLLSSLAHVEAAAVLGRLAARREVPVGRARTAIRSLLGAPWTGLEIQPDRRLAADLAMRAPLRGADLWHLALALTLQAELPELRFLTFDERLAGSARSEGVLLAS